MIIYKTTLYHNNKKPIGFQFVGGAEITGTCFIGEGQTKPTSGEVSITVPNDCDVSRMQCAVKAPQGYGNVKFTVYVDDEYECVSATTTINIPEGDNSSRGLNKDVLCMLNEGSQISIKVECEDTITCYPACSLKCYF